METDRKRSTVETDKKKSTVETGRKYEDIAYQYLQKAGMKLLQKNFRCRQGEIDIIGLHKGCLVFVEVKYRSSIRSGLPEEAVGDSKQKKICRASDYFRMKYPRFSGMQVRYDVLALCKDEVRWYQNAFFYRTEKQGISW